MHSLRRTIIGMLIGGLTLSGLPLTASAEASMTMTLAPHCTTEMRADCPSFDVTDGSSIKTNRLAAGDILDLDVVVSGPDYASVRSVRAWLNYDPSVLEYRSVELTKELPSPTPGEQTADPVGKVVKVGGNTNAGLSGDNRAVARVTFRVLSTANNVVISFNDFKSDGSGHTAVNGSSTNAATKPGSLPEPPCISSIIGCRGTPTPLLAIEPSTLNVSLKDPATMVPAAVAAQLIDSSASSSSAMSSSVSSPMTDPAAGTTDVSGLGDSTFGILQVQGVRVTTRDTLVFLGWNELKSAGLKGYNVYYSTVSGKYIQRHSVPKTETSLTLRNLAPDTTYYFAVRAVNMQDQESVFSQEVSVTVGRPETASAPLLATQVIGLEQTMPEGNPMEIHNGQTIRGETGLNDIVFMIIAASALVGTAFAFRRQASLAHLQNHAA